MSWDSWFTPKQEKAMKLSDVPAQVSDYIFRFKDESKAPPEFLNRKRPHSYITLSDAEFQRLFRENRENIIEVKIFGKGSGNIHSLYKDKDFQLENIQKSIDTLGVAKTFQKIINGEDFLRNF